MHPDCTYCVNDLRPSRNFAKKLLFRDTHSILLAALLPFLTDAKRRFLRASVLAFIKMVASVLQVSAAAVVEAGKRPVLWQPTTQGPGDPAWDGAMILTLSWKLPHSGSLPLFPPCIDRYSFF